MMLIICIVCASLAKPQEARDSQLSTSDLHNIVKLFTTYPNILYIQNDPRYFLNPLQYTLGVVVSLIKVGKRKHTVNV